MPHQLKALDRFAGKPSAAFFMFMRLGKSLTALRWRRTLCDPGPTLLATPNSALNDWLDELKREKFSSYVYRGTQKKQSETLEQVLTEEENAVMIVTYDMLRARLGFPLVAWSCAILDESTSIKEPKTAVTKVAMKLCKRVPNRAVLTGLPAPQHLSNLWTQMAFAYGGSWMGFDNFWGWRKAYFFETGPHQWRPKQDGTPIKEALHEDAFVLTRKQAQKEGATPVHKVIRRDAEEEVMAVQNEILGHWRIESRLAKYSLQLSSWLVMVAGGFTLTDIDDIDGSKYRPLPCWKYEWLLSIREQSLLKRYIIWHFRLPEVERTVNVLEAHGVTVAELSGRVPPHLRKAQVERFREGSSNVLVATPKTAMMGVDLSCADAMIYLSRPWSYEQRAQSLERCWHPRRKRPIYVYDLVTVGTIDEEVMLSIKEKNSSAVWLLEKFKRRRGK